MPRPPNPELPGLLLDAAVALVDERGDVDFSMRELAARIGYSVTAVYRCFETRGHLLRVVALRLFDDMVLRLSQPEAESMSTNLVRVGEGFLTWAVENPGRYRLMFQHSEPDARLTEEEQEVARAGLRYMGSVLARAGVDNPNEMATVVFSLLHGLASLSIAGRLEPKAEEIVPFYYAHVAPLIAEIAGQ